MYEDENGHNPENENVQSPQKKKDWWDKAGILSKFLAAILVVAIGIWGNHYLNKRQEKDTNFQLYTQLLSNKETSENTLRKDMFVKILESFLEPKQTENPQRPLARVREMRLNLELLSRNFHESLDMKPLFHYLLMEIIRPRLILKRLSKALADCDANKSRSSGNCDTHKVRNLYNKARRLTNKELMQIDFCKIDNDSKINLAADVKELLRGYDRELDLLIQAAKRVTRKQREILEDVSGELRLTVNLTGDESKKVCTEYSPLDWLPEKEGTCEKKHDKNEKRACVENDDQKSNSVENNNKTITGIETDGILWFNNSNGQKDEESARYFLMRVRYIYPRWKQVYVEILTCPVEEGKEMTEEICEKKCKECPKINNKATFWLEYFDFPLVDNTYIDSKQRYSVILEGFEADECGNDGKAKITLLYYPSSYSGLKEKSFYNNQLMRVLIKSELFPENRDQKGVKRDTPPVIIGPTNP